MNRTASVSFFRGCALLVVVAALLLTPASAIAAESAGQRTTSTGAPAATTTLGTTTGAGDEKGEGGGESPASNADGTAIAIVFIGFAALGILVLFIYLAFSQAKFFKAAGLVFGQTRVVPEAVPVPAFSRAALTGEGAVPIEIKGPATFSVGEEATFSALSAGSEIAVDWEVTPAESASPASAKGSSITFKASTQTVFTVTAKAPEEKGEAAVQVSAVTPVPDRPSLPFIGENYGAALIAIVAVAGVVALGLAEVVKGEAIATFFGALLGYAFGKGLQSSQSGTPTTSNPGSDPPE
jgi:hypothetical protein